MHRYGSHNKPKEPEITEEDLYVIVGLALGMTHEQTGQFVCTLKFPTGITGRCVRNWLGGEKSELYARAIRKISTRWADAKEEFRKLTQAELRGEIERLRHKAIRVKETALDHALQNPNDTTAVSVGDKAADRLIDRDLGRATNVHKIEGELTHKHQIWGAAQPRALLESQERDIADSDDLLTSLDIVEAEVLH